ncbi:hypothetical protein ACWGH3_02530 [Streptomyces sp. NPDC054884]
MSSAHRLEPSEEEARPQLTGTWSLMMGSAAVAAIGCPLLPESVPYQLRFLPVYFVLPLGVWAVASGIIALRRTGGDEGARRNRARAGITLGAVATVTVVATLVRAYWALRRI